MTASGKNGTAKAVKLLVNCRKKCRERVTPEIESGRRILHLIFFLYV
jgi:hypothetical protein